MLTVYTAHIQIAVAAESEGEAADAVSAMLSENLMQSGALLDWQYARKGDAYDSPTDTGREAPDPFCFEEGSLFLPSSAPGTQYAN